MTTLFNAPMNKEVYTKVESVMNAIDDDAFNAIVDTISHVFLPDSTIDKKNAYNRMARFAKNHLLTTSELAAWFFMD